MSSVNDEGSDCAAICRFLKEIKYVVRGGYIYTYADGKC